MKTVIIEYATIAPNVLAMKIEKAFPGAMTTYKDIDEDYFEFSVWGCTDLEMLEDVLAQPIFFDCARTTLERSISVYW